MQTCQKFAWNASACVSILEDSLTIWLPFGGGCWFCDITNNNKESRPNLWCSSRVTRLELLSTKLSELLGKMKKTREGVVQGEPRHRLGKDANLQNCRLGKFPHMFVKPYQGDKLNHCGWVEFLVVVSSTRMFAKVLNWSVFRVNLPVLMAYITYIILKIRHQLLVGGFNPSEKNSQIGNLPQIGVNIKIFETTT